MAKQTIDADYLWDLAMAVKEAEDYALSKGVWRNVVGKKYGLDSPQYRVAQKKVTRAHTEVFVKQIALLDATAKWPFMYDELIALVYGEDIDEVYANREYG